METCTTYKPAETIMSQHTPGPWAVREYTAEEICVAVSGDPQDFIASVDVEAAGYPVLCQGPLDGSPPHRPIEEVSANARLIAAAPDLYDSCLSALGALETLKSEHPWVGEIIVGLTRSLKKATEGVRP
jgi:hypothetical protein